MFQNYSKSLTDRSNLTNTKLRRCRVIIDRSDSEGEIINKNHMIPATLATPNVGDEPKKFGNESRILGKLSKNSKDRPSPKRL